MGLGDGSEGKLIAEQAQGPEFGSLALSYKQTWSRMSVTPALGMGRQVNSRAGRPVSLAEQVSSRFPEKLTLSQKPRWKIY